jgi:phosphoglycerol transferase MdoB-like AlkP superfamily enzyme
MSEAQTPKNELELQSAIFGIPISTIALISLTQKVFNVGLTAFFSSFITFWRTITSPISGILKGIFSIVSIKLPDWYIDAYVLAFIIGVIAFRNVLSDGKTPIVNTLVGWVLAAMFAIPLLLMPIAIFGWRVSEKDEQLGRKVTRDIVAVLSLTVVFFALNAGVR